MYFLKLKSNRERFPDLGWLIFSIVAAIDSWFLIIYCIDHTSKTFLYKFLGPISVFVLIGAVIAFCIYLWKNIVHIFKDYRLVSTKLIKFRKGIDPLGEEEWDD